MKLAKEDAKEKSANAGRALPRRSRRERRARKLDRIDKRLASARPETIGNAEDALRMILTMMRVPLACEEKACRRSLRCAGSTLSAYGRPVIACYERHREVLQPYFTRHIVPALKAEMDTRQSSDELED